MDISERINNDIDNFIHNQADNNGSSILDYSSIIHHSKCRMNHIILLLLTIIPFNV